MLLSVTADLVVAAYPACDSLLQRLEYNAGFVQFKTNEEFSSNSIHQKHLIRLILPSMHPSLPLTRFRITGGWSLSHPHRARAGACEPRLIQVVDPQTCLKDPKAGVI